MKVHHSVLKKFQNLNLFHGLRTCCQVAAARSDIIKGLSPTDTPRVDLIGGVERGMSCDYSSPVYFEPHLVLFGKLPLWSIPYINTSSW